jgi:cyclophilin family peptidyl-prolyl cis-trans isomerase
MENEESLVTCETTKGTVTIKLIRNWSPHGYDRAVELFQRHFYDGVHFFRVVKGFLTQFGISYSDDKELQQFAKKQFPDDPKENKPNFEPGFVSFAGSGKNSRTSQLFISYGYAKSLGSQPWETPIGKVIEGMESTVTHFHSYGDIPPFGEGPDQQKIHGHPEYIEKNFPLTDKILQCHVERIEGGDIAGELQLDEEEERREKHLREKKPKIPERHRDLRNPEMFAAQRKIMKESQESNTPVVAAGAMVVALVLGIIYMLLKGRKKILSKLN